MNEHLHPESSPLFSPWTDPSSGVVSYVLTERAAAWQQGFYFTSPNITDDGRWIWLYAADPPSPHVLALVDVAEGSVEVFPDTHFEAESPHVDTTTGEVFWAHPGGVFRRQVGSDQPVVEVATIGRDVTKRRDVRRLSTHLTRSADGELLNLDLWLGDSWNVGVVDIATGDFDLWFTSQRRFQHSQFHPSEPRRLMLAQDYWLDDTTGKRQHWENRIWVMDDGGPPEPVFPSDHERVKYHFHEWWSTDGASVLYVDAERGTERVDLATGAQENLWSNGICHSHASADQTLFVGDINTYNWEPVPCRVSFYDATTGVEVDVISAWPWPAPRAYAGYHPDPHPQFVLDDEFIAYTTSALGGLDFALVRVSDLLARTRSS